MKNGKQVALGGIVIAAVVLLGGTVAHAGICLTCGSNSATVGDGIIFDELNSQHQRRGDGPRIGKAMLADGTEVTVQVQRHFLSAVDAKKRTYRGEQLVGMIVNLDMKDGRAYQLRLARVGDGCRHDTVCDPKRKERACDPMTFWVSPYEDVPYYEFLFRKTSRRTGVAALEPDREAGADPRRSHDRPLKVCAKPEGAKAEGAKASSYSTSSNGTCPDRCKEEEFTERLCNGELHSDDELWGTHRATAIVFEGDHYDVDKKTVSETKPKEKGWFNLACAGTAPFKMHMLRHTKAGSITPDGTPRNTTLSQRTAMLKAITADYCGDGRGWTGDGTKLWWGDGQGWFQFPTSDIIGAADSKGVEAIWGPNGALCLNTPRRKPEPPAPLSTYPACDVPSVDRPSVESICYAANHTYTERPPVSGKGATKTQKIPPCDAAWIDWWMKQVGKSPTSDLPYVITVNREKHADAAKYCNPSPGFVPP